MQEELISFETAKLAKEKGFDWETQKVYDAGETNIKNPTIYVYGEDLSRDDELYAPTQSLLQRWLREVHKIECYAYPYRDHADDNNDPIRYRGYRSGMKMFNTFEEALENDLQEALKLIKL